MNIEILNMPSRHHLDDITRGRIIGKLEEGRKIRDVAHEFNIAHIIVSMLRAAFKKSGICTRRTGRNHPGSTTSQEGRYIVISAKKNRRSTVGQLANQLCAAAGTKILWKTVARRLKKGGLYAQGLITNGAHLHQ